MTAVMAKKVTPDSVLDVAAVETDRVDAPGASVEPVKRPVFRDKEFTSRTLILSNKRTVQVVGGVVEATDPELLTFLRTRSSFELVTE